MSTLNRPLIFPILGDAVLYADLDYPDFKTTMRWLQDARGARLVKLVVPPRASQEQLQGLYYDAFDENPDLKRSTFTRPLGQRTRRPASVICASCGRTKPK